MITSGARGVLTQPDCSSAACGRGIGSLTSSTSPTPVSCRSLILRDCRPLGRAGACEVSGPVRRARRLPTAGTATCGGVRRRAAATRYGAGWTTDLARSTRTRGRRTSGSAFARVISGCRTRRRPLPRPARAAPSPPLRHRAGRRVRDLSMDAGDVLMKVYAHQIDGQEHRNRAAVEIAPQRAALHSPDMRSEAENAHDDDLGPPSPAR